MKLRTTLLGALLVCAARCASAQDTPTPAAATDYRTQYPAFMTNSYFTFTVGSIGYLFSNTQLEPGFQAASIDKPRLAVRADFFGHENQRICLGEAWLCANLQVTQRQRDALLEPDFGRTGQVDCRLAEPVYDVDTRYS